MANKNYYLFDPVNVDHLLPLAYTRPVAHFRVGVLTIQEKWEIDLSIKTSIVTQDRLQPLFPNSIAEGVNIYINAAVLPDSKVVEAIAKLEEGQVLLSKNQVVACCSSEKMKNNLDYLHQRIKDFSVIEYQETFSQIHYNWDIFHLNGQAIEADINRLKILDKVESNTNHLAETIATKNENSIYIEESATIGACILNAEKGSIYIGKNATILDGSMIQGPVAICDNAVVKMGAKIYGETTIGPHCKVGGEVSNSVLFGYSNKGHDGYLGNSVLGEWCNLGADTNNSNLKNNYGKISCWDYGKKDYISTGLQFCGLIMGDHAKSGINTMFNTGTIVGVAANVFGGGFPAKFIPSFSWGGSDGFGTFRLDKSYEMATNMMKRRKLEFTENHKAIFKSIFEEDSPFRS